MGANTSAFDAWLTSNDGLEEVERRDLAIESVIVSGVLDDDLIDERYYVAVVGQPEPADALLLLTKLDDLLHDPGVLNAMRAAISQMPTPAASKADQHVAELLKTIRTQRDVYDAARAEEAEWWLDNNRFESRGVA